MSLLKTPYFIFTIITLCFNLQAHTVQCSSLLNTSLNNKFNNLELSLEQPKELKSKWKGGIRRALGAKLIKIKSSSIDELAETVYKNKDKYDLVFKGDQGLFTDLGIFKLLKESKETLTIKANRTKDFHIVKLPSGRYVIYLKNKTAYGEELSFVSSQITTGALLAWFEKNRPYEFSTLEKIRSEHSDLSIDLSLKSISKYANHEILKSLSNLSKVHKILDNKDLELAVNLTSFHNKLKVLSSNRQYSPEEVVDFYQRTKKEVGFLGESSEIRMLTFFGLLAEITPENTKRLFDNAGGFFSSTSDNMAVFMGIATQIKMDKLNGKISNGPVTLETLEQYLKIHKTLYKQADEVTGFWTDNSMFTYIAAATSSRTKVTDLEKLEQDARYINKHAEGDSDGALLVFSSASKEPLESILKKFNSIYKIVKDDEIALSLLEVSTLPGQSVDSALSIYEKASFKGEKIDSDELSSLLVAGSKANLRAGEVVAMVKEASAYTGGKLTEVDLISFVESTIFADNFSQQYMGGNITKIIQEQIAEEVRRQTTTNIIVMTVAINSINSAR